MTERIYLDNAATSFPKPDCVYDAVDRYNREIGCAVGRGTSRYATELGQTVSRCRKRLSDLLGVGAPDRVIFTQNGTDSLNLVLHGLLRPGDHVVTTQVEHNSVIRPLRHLEQAGIITVTVVNADRAGRVAPEEMRKAVQDNTRLLAFLHASNVTGTIQPIGAFCEIARSAGALSLVDAAQSAGSLSINMRDLDADFLACPGHKGLLGPLGTGVLCLGPKSSELLDTVRQGGTGTTSESEFQPETLPDKLESGNHNAPGIVGLEAGLAWLEQETVAAVHARETALIARLIDGIRSFPNWTVHGPTEAEERVGVVSLSLQNAEPQVLATILDDTFGIQTRAGLHCAPGVHRAIGTLESGGTLRLSVGPLTTTDEIDAAIDALGQLSASW